MKVEDQKIGLNRWYEYMKKQQHENADTQKNKIETHLAEFTDSDSKKLYKLLKVRYYLMYKDFDKSTEALAETQLEKDKYHWLNYYYYFFHGIYHYNRKEYKKAVNYYNKARLFISDIPIEETAELYYKLASACTRIYQISLSIKYAERALEIFKNRSHFKRMADCENLLGLNNHEIDQYKEAEQRYQEALPHVEKTDDQLLKLRILHNLGHLYSDKNDPKTAIDYLKQVYDFLNSDGYPFHDHYLKVQNLYLLARNYFKIGQTEKAEFILNTGHTLSIDQDVNNYHCHFKILRAKFLEPAHYETYYIQSISYFNDHRQWEYVDEYGEDLAFYYRETKNHEKAARYFHLAAKARNQIKKERTFYYD